MNKLAEIRMKLLYPANPFLEAQRDLDVVGLRILALAQSDIRPRLSANAKVFDKEFRTFRMPAKDVVELFKSVENGARRTDMYERLKTTCDKMGKSIIRQRIYDDDGR